MTTIRTVAAALTLAAVAVIVATNAATVWVIGRR